MNNEDREQTADPAKLLPYEKRLLPEDPNATIIPKKWQPVSPALFSEHYN
jgi:hypothetical protein